MLVNWGFIIFGETSQRYPLTEVCLGFLKCRYCFCFCHIYPKNGFCLLLSLLLLVHWVIYLLHLSYAVKAQSFCNICGEILAYLQKGNLIHNYFLHLLPVHIENSLTFPDFLGSEISFLLYFSRLTFEMKVISWVPVMSL